MKHPLLQLSLTLLLVALTHGLAGCATSNTDPGLRTDTRRVSFPPGFLPTETITPIIGFSLGTGGQSAAPARNTATPDPGGPELVSLIRGQAKDARGDYKGAIADYNQAIRMNPASIEAYFYRGTARQATGNSAGAIADFDRVVALDPKNATAYNNRSYAKHATGDLAGARADLDKALELNPLFPAALISRGAIKYFTRDYAGAIADADTVLRLTPFDLLAHRNRAAARHALGDFEGALADYDRCIALVPNGAAYERFYRHLILRRLQREEPAAAFASAVATRMTGWPQTVGRYLTGTLPEKDFLAAAAQGNASTARSHQAEAFYFVGLTHLLAGDTAAAKDFLGRCVALNVTGTNALGLAQAELARLQSPPPPALTP
jgi:tetratricopeptide (TPR) repeat protein